MQLFVERILKNWQENIKCTYMQPGFLRILPLHLKYLKIYKPEVQLEGKRAWHIIEIIFVKSVRYYAFIEHTSRPHRILVYVIFNQ